MILGIGWAVRCQCVDFKALTPAALRDTIQSFGRFAVLAYVLAYALNTISILPPIAGLSLTAGLAFGAAWGTLYLMTGAMIGTSATFFISRFLGRELIVKMLKARFSDMDEKLAQKGFLTVLFFRIIPLIPYEVLNYACGLSKMKFRDYFLATFLGLIPGVVVAAYFGGTLGQVTRLKDLMSFQFLTALAVLAVVILVPVVYRSIAIVARPGRIRSAASRMADKRSGMKSDFDVMVIGGGAAGLVAATGAAGLGAKTALIEKSKLGGDCTWYGCIPSKALLKSAQVFSLVKRLGEFGISGHVPCGPDGVMAHVRDVVQQVSRHHPPEVFEKRGIKVMFGSPRFVDNRSVEINGQRFSSKRFIICTGSRPVVPAIEGLGDSDYLTNENIFDLKALPESMVVLGAGPIGMEISQAMARLGVEVRVVEMENRILPREDEEAAQVLARSLEQQGITIYTGHKAVKCVNKDHTVTILLEDKHKKRFEINAQKVFVAVGRAAQVQGLDLEKAGVKYSPDGIEADLTLRTTAKNIYACGDVVGPYLFSHMAEYQAIIAVGNALFPFKQRVRYHAVPWCTFTDPELAHLGLTQEEAKARYKHIKIYKSSFEGNDRAVTDLEEKGFAKVICDKNGRILGAHIVGAGAGELIHEYVLAKSRGIKIGQLSSMIHVYPTLSQVVKRSADQYYMEMLSWAWVKALSNVFVKLMR